MPRPSERGEERGAWNEGIQKCGRERDVCSATVGARGNDLSSFLLIATLATDGERRGSQMESVWTREG